MLSALLLASAALVSAQSATTSSSRSTPTGSSGEPCADIADLVRSFEDIIPAKLAFDCLNSVPVDKSGNEKLIDELKLLWQWQSDSGFLKKPPQTWDLGALDINKELDNIKSNLGSFKSEYEVQNAIQNITIRSGNFHFNYRPDITRMFRWWRTVGVASISSDGKELPKVYTEGDALALSGGDNSDISEITEINGQDPYEYLAMIGRKEQYLDGDGQLANVVSPGDTDSYGAFEVQGHYWGETTELKFANGSSGSFDNYARFGAASRYKSGEFNGTTYWRRVSDGQSFFNVFCTGDFTGEFLSELSASATNTKVGAARLMSEVMDDRPVHDGKIIKPGKMTRKRQSIPDEIYPDPVVEDESEVVAGYFMSGQGYEDVAVLKIVSFMPDEDYDEDGTDFQRTVRNFLAQCTRQQKKKLVLDLRENGGGMVALLLDTLIQLFPQTVPYTAQTFRATEQFTALGDALMAILDLAEKEGSYSYIRTRRALERAFPFWAWWNMVNGQGDNFKSWDDYNGPVGVNGDEFTTLHQFNMSNDNTESILHPGFYFTNTSNRAPFEPKNIVMLTDGLCGSACASFAEQLKNLHGVRSVAIGGRPTNAPMQQAAGSKGGIVLPIAYMVDFGRTLIATVTRLGRSTIRGVPALTNLNDTDVKPLADTSQLLIRAGDEFTRVQTREWLRKGDASGTPIEFIYDAADCKVFYTASSYADPTAAWRQTWDAFVDDGKCVKGSTQDKSSISGGFKPFGTGEVGEEQLPKQGGGGGKNGSNEEDAAAAVRVGGLALAAAVAWVVLLL